MNNDEFWTIVDSSRQDCGPLSDFDYAVQCQRLRASLWHLPLDEIISFDMLLWYRRMDAYRNDLAAAAHMISEASGDDGFDLFRIGLISLGRRVYETALVDVEKLADVPEICQIPDWFGEDEAMRFAGIANEVYRGRTNGEDIQHVSMVRPRVPSGLAWALAELPELYPKLWAKFGHRLG